MDYLARKQRPKVIDPFAEHVLRPTTVYMSQQEWDDLVGWGESTEEEEARKEKMRTDKFLIKQQVVTTTSRSTGPSGSSSRGVVKSLSARATKRRKKVEKGKCR